jgi:hypothetical protein
MKANQHRNRLPAQRRGGLRLLLGLAFGLASMPSLLAQLVPDRLNYQAVLLKGDGTPVAAVPTDVVFRIYDQADGGNLLWSRTQSVTPDTNGLFSVVLMDGGAPYESAQFTNLAPVFTSGTELRYLELYVPGAGAAPIKPRQRFVAAPYAFLAQNVVEAKQNFNVSGTLTVSSAANVNSLTASGAANVGSLTATGAVQAASFAGSGAGLTNINTNSLVQQIVEALCPPGTIVAFGGQTNKIPSGWLLCDGRSFNQSDYPRLFSAISTNWGSTNSSVSFNLPDLRGMFLRGVNLTRADSYQDPDKNLRSGSVGGNSANLVGSLQTNALQNVTGNVGEFNSFAALSGGASGPFAITNHVKTGQGIPGGYSDWHDRITFDLSRVARTSTETRPNNAYVNYIIKY